MPPSRVETHTYVFLYDNNGHWGIIHQPADPTYADGTPYPHTWGDAVTGNPSVTADYMMKSPESDECTRNALLAIPSLSVVMDDGDLFQRVINSGGKQRNKGLEQAASIEMLYPTNPARNFQIDCGFRPRSRALQRNPKRGFLILFRKEFGPSRLRQRAFATAPRNRETAAKDFKRLILRQSFVDCWTGQGYNDDEDTFTRDANVREALLDVQGGRGTHNAWVHLYLNGLYFGLYNLTEEIDEHHAADYFGGDDEDWLVVKSRVDSTDDGDVKAGDDSRYRRMLELIGHQGNRSLADDRRYSEVVEYLDPGRLAEYIVTHCFYGTGDWPDNNWYFLMRTHPPRPGFFQIWDAEKSLARLYTHDVKPGDGRHQAWYSTVLREGRAVPARAWRAMITNEDFRLIFADTVQRLLFNGGPLTDANARRRWLDLARHLGLDDRDHAAVIGEAARWGDHPHVDDDIRPADYDDWKRAVDRVTAQLDDNVSVFLREFSEVLPDVSPPAILHNNNVVSSQRVTTSSGATVIMTAEDGAVVYYTLDASDPRKFGEPDRGAPVGFRYENPISIERSLILKARAHRVSTGEWSALTAVEFQIPQTSPTLKMTEIMYHPVEGGHDFLELMNVSDKPLQLYDENRPDLTWRIEGIDFTFPPFVELQPGEVILLVRDTATPADCRKTLDVPAEVRIFTFSGKLDNGGETLTVMERGYIENAETMTVVDRVRYDDTAPWPTAPDGGGPSLQRISCQVDGSLPANWRTSEIAGGTPGRHSVGP